MPQFELIPQWVTPLVRVRNPDHARIKPALVAHAYERERASSTAIASGIAGQMKGNLYESTFDFFRTEIPEVQALARFCSEAVGGLVTELRRSVGRTEPAGSLRIEMVESWVHITRDGGYHDQHLHPNCSWCGIYYIDPGDATHRPPNGCNRFYAPFEPNYRDFGTTALNTDPADVAPEEGVLVLFPSYLYHSGIVYRGARDRIIASFNSRVRQMPATAG
jgi:uncharacterized protein (TIGR02466 family)